MRRHRLLFGTTASIAVVLFGFYGCDATGGSQLSNDDDGSSHSQGGAGGGVSLTVGSGGTNPNYCYEPNCIGNTPQGQCDTGLPIDASNPMDGVRAMGLCQEYVDGGWGVVSAEWVRADGQPLTGGDLAPLESGRGALPKFGPITPREGAAMLVLSSGSARAPGDPDFADPGGHWKDTVPHGSPPGYPKESPACPGVTTGEPYDSAGLRVTIRTPVDANSFAFDFDFYTYEYPDYVCDVYNDFFVAMMTPQPSGLVDGNISFDGQGNTISVNAGFLDACQPCNAGGKNFACALGYGEITGTGFDSNLAFTCAIQGSAATSWLVTTAPVESPGSDITLHFAIWDSGDGVLDSTVLIDNFKFDPEEGDVGTIPVPE